MTFGLPLRLLPPRVRTVLALAGAGGGAVLLACRQALAAAGEEEMAAALPLSLLSAVLLGAALLWLGLFHLRLRRRVRAQGLRNARLAAANASLREVADRAESKARLLDSVLAAMADGVAVVDAEQRLTGWNARFPDVAGVPRHALRIGMPMEAVIRLQAEAGEFGLVDPEAEVSRRMEVLLTGAWPERWQRLRPDGTRVELRRAALPGGGHVTLYTPLGEAQGVRPDGLAAAFAGEWADRLPRLTAAAADGDLEGVHRAAHTLRGIAANAGWPEAAEVLRVLEREVEAKNLSAIRLAVTRLQPDPPGYLR